MNLDTSGLRNEELITELLISGSSVIDTKNDRGVYLFGDINPKDGVIYDGVSKAKYNQNELEKVVDTEIKELITPDLSDQQSTVLADLYDAKVAENDLLTLENEELRNQLNIAEAAIAGLENTLENALIDLDQKDLLLAAAENQSKQSNEKVISTIKELQNAIQRATAESIERTKLAATNTALMDQLNAYSKQLDTSVKTLNTSNIRLNDLSRDNQTKSAQMVTLQRQVADAQAQVADTIKAKLKGISIICTESHRQGLMPDNIYLADNKFGKYMIRNHPNIIRGYWIWASPVVKWMQNNPTGSKIFYNFIVKHWSEHMAYRMNVLEKDNKFGNFIHIVGTKFSKFVYNVSQIKNQFKPVVSYS